MRKHYFLFSILVLSFSLSLPQTLSAQCMPNSYFPSGYVPFTSIYYISAPDTAGDLLVVGSMTLANFQELNYVPVPNNTSGNQLFCNPITLAPGIVANAYVPTLAERLGDFAAFSSILFDPTYVSEGDQYYYPNGQITAAEIPTVFAWRIPPTQPGPTVYVSAGSQILAVDGSSGVTSVLFNSPDSNSYFDFEGLAVGPDNLIYFASPIGQSIFRIDQSGNNFSTVYQHSEGSPGPVEPQGPSFSTTGLLTFNSEDGDGVWQISLPCSSLPCTPVQIIPVGAAFGQGTTFNLSDQLLIVDWASNAVLQQTAVGASTASPLISNTDYLSNPIGVAVDSFGNIYVSNSRSASPTGSPNINQFALLNGQEVFANEYVSFFLPSEGLTCTPFFLQFDASNRLYVATQDPFYEGQVWRVDPNGSPPTAGTATLLVDLGYASSNGTIPGYNGHGAVGVALVGTGTTNSYTTPQQQIPPTCSSSGCTVTTSYGAVIPSNTYTFPAGTDFGGAASIAVDFQLWNPTAFDTTRLTNMTTNTWSGGTPVPNGTTCTPIAGTGGNCIVIEALCYAANGTAIVPCQISAPLGQVIWLASTYETQSPQPYPGLIIADDGQNDWANITASSSGDTTVKGPTNSLNTDTAIVNLNLSGQAPSFTFTGVPTTAGYQSTFDVTATTSASTTPVMTATAGSVCTLGTPSPTGSSTTVAVTMTSGTGTCNLTAFSPADTTYAAGYSLPQSIGATTIAPTVGFTGAPGSAAYNSTFTVTATTNASTPAVIAATAGSVCSVGAPSTTASSAGTSTTATVTMTSGSGTCNLTASWAADNNYSAVPVSSRVTQSTTASPATQTITVTTPAPGTQYYGLAFTVAATATSALPVAITTSGGCSGSGSASATITMTSGTTTCTVIFNQAGNTNYSAAPTVSSLTYAAKVASTVNVTSNTPNPSAPGQAVVVSFTVAGNGLPTGYVTVAASTGEACSPVTLVAGAGSCSLTFYTVGSRTLTASYSGDANFNGSTSTAVVTQTVNGPLASVSPTSINFGTVYLATITVKSVTVSNVGNAPMTITTPFFSILSGGDPSEFVAVNLCPKSLAAGSTCTIYVSFIAGPYYSPQTAVLRVVDSAYNSPQTVALFALVINPRAWLSATRLSFGMVKVGSSSAPEAVTLKNTGATALAITNIALAGNNSAGFSLSPPSTCPISPAATLPAGSSCTISVTFTPTAKGSRSASVVITDNALSSPQTISLSGTGD